MDLVVFSNHMNKMNLGILKDKELDLFMSICLKLRDEGTKKIELKFSELKELSNYEIKNYQRFLNDLRGVNKKLLTLNCEYETDTEISGFVLFTDYTIHKVERKLTVQVNEKFKYILNELTENFTKFELSQFVGLNSQYSKTIFRLLKQFSGTGWREFLLSDFRELLNIPVKYRISEIDKYVLNKKIVKELQKSFTKLKVLKIKKGREVYKIRFEWDVVTLLPPKKEKKGKEIEKTTKEINTDNIIKKQSEEIELGEIINREIDGKYNKYLQLAEQIKIEIEEKVYKKYLEKSNAKDSKIIRGIFEKSKKSLIVEEYQEYIEEQYDIKENEILEELEPTPKKILEEEPKQSLENFEEENPVGWEEKIFVIYPPTELEVEAEKIIKTIFPFIDDELLDEDINYVRSTLRRKKMYKELETLDLFLETKQSPVVNPKDIYKDEHCLGFSDFGKEYIENYIKEHHLEHLLVSKKTKKELKGSARESRLVKLYKNDFKII